MLNFALSFKAYIFISFLTYFLWTYKVCNGSISPSSQILHDSILPPKCRPTGWKSTARRRPWPRRLQMNGTRREQNRQSACSQHPLVAAKANAPAQLPRGASPRLPPQRLTLLISHCFHALIRFRCDYKSRSKPQIFTGSQVLRHKLIQRKHEIFWRQYRRNGARYVVIKCCPFAASLTFSCPCLRQTYCISDWPILCRRKYVKATNDIR